MESYDSDNDYFGNEECLDGDLESTCWMLEALEQKNPRLTVALAHSMLLIYHNSEEIIGPARFN